MFKRILVALLALLAFSVFAADVNTATQADLEAIKGIGPAIATKIVTERKKGSYKDWSDLVGRVKGVGATSAAKLSTAGLTVNGATYGGAPAATAKAVAPAIKTAAAAAPAADARKAAKAAKKADKAASAASTAAAKKK